MSSQKRSGPLQTLKAYVDLTRLQFGFAWPLLFCSGLFLATQHYSGFSWLLVVKAALIGFFGFEAGFVLNDYVDRDLDQRDVEDSLTKYWRMFKKRPLASGMIKPNQALALFIIFVAITLILIGTLPYPHSLYLLIIMIYCYSVEYFYQTHKRNQKYPVAQLIGRTDFALFPVAGYLVVGNPDVIALLYFVFFYPFAMAHLGLNDLVDIKNDIARKMKSVTVLYDTKGTATWILMFTLIHYVTASIFLLHLGTIALIGFIIGFILLAIVNILIMKKKTPQAGLKTLPLFHVTMIIYSVSLILDVWF